MIGERKSKYRVFVWTEKDIEIIKNWEVSCITPFGEKRMGFEKFNEQEKSH